MESRCHGRAALDARPLGSRTFSTFGTNRFFLLVATHGKHPFFAEEAASIRDVRKVPIKFAGHSISYKRGGFLRRVDGEPSAPDTAWHSRVQIERERYAELKAYFQEIACKRSPETIARELFGSTL